MTEGARTGFNTEEETATERHSHTRRAVRAAFDAIAAELPAETAQESLSVNKIATRALLATALLHGLGYSVRPDLRQLRTLLPEELSKQLLPHWPRWLSFSQLSPLLELGREPVTGRLLGRVYQASLQVQLLWLRGPSLCLKPFGTWVRLSDLHECPAAERATLLRKLTSMNSETARRLQPRLALARSQDELVQALSRITLSTIKSEQWVSQPSRRRQRLGSHYTPDELTQPVAQACLEPLLTNSSSQALQTLRVCDPAMGAGAFLVAAGKILTRALTNAWRTEGRNGSDASARDWVFNHCLFGVDVDETAVVLARINLWLESGRTTSFRTHITHLHVGDALVGADPKTRNTSAPYGALVPFHWHEQFQPVFERTNAGFDAVLGNPPWVAFAGRAAQPLGAQRRTYFEHHFRCFRQYRTLHGLFVERATQLLRVGGRLGLVLPTSVSDLDGYRATRESHDENCVTDTALPEFTDDAFAHVFQPSMALLSTRVEPTIARHPRSPTWTLNRDDLTPIQHQLLERLSQLPRVARELFGERGYQTTAADRTQIQAVDGGARGTEQQLRTGSEVGEFRRQPARWCVAPERLAGKWRPAEEWSAVAVLIRQTARFPIAAISDGLPFRNSILAAFAQPDWPSHLLVAYLNSTPVRWLHFQRHRDARQGMPQLKVGHLRSLPAPPTVGTETGRALTEFGRGLNERNRGISETERDTLDALVAREWGFDEHELRCLSDFRRDHPPPKARKSASE